MAMLRRRSPITFSASLNSKKNTSSASRNCLFPTQINPKFKRYVAVMAKDCSAPLIETLINRKDLSQSEVELSLDFLQNDADEALISAFLVLLRSKGETYEEVWQER
ncbi:hypothetical protein Nepgr_018628 [Nepenthes gracilis]|uniref:Glycosyl transferase family 3 N-terminal domain-containing protein n=1 Tax=Nepenthes gracilis TaxID=150966 RepID=A0AAD3SUF1_NEPGR|nr:hypothetical protein Nepgr_018628 [Nepenthes gracilis]